MIELPTNEDLLKTSRSGVFTRFEWRCPKCKELLSGDSMTWDAICKLAPNAAEFRMSEERAFMDRMRSEIEAHLKEHA